MKHFIIVAFDPSIKSTGFAALKGFYRDRPDDPPAPDPQLIECGTIRVTQQRQGKVIPSIERIESLLEEIREIVNRFDGARFVIEITSGKTSGRGKREANGAGLGTYGMVVGRVVAELLHTQSDVHQVYENDWTAGFSKADRKRTAALAYPAYGAIEQERDPGGDISDAIMLAEWDIRRVELQARMEVVA